MLRHIRTGLVIAQLVAGTAHAQSRPTRAEPATLAGASNEGASAKTLYESGTTRRGYGMLFTALGVACGAAAIAFAYTGDSTRDGLPTPGTAGAVVATGVLGLTGLIAGPILWSSGADRMSRAQQMGYSPTQVSLFASPIPNGLVAGIQAVQF